jgi:hypothetical protein
MTIIEKLNILEKKIELVMDHLGLDLPAQEQQEPLKPDTSMLELELQKTLNQIKVLKIKFRNLPAKSPARQATLDQLEELNQTKTHLEADLNAKR